jgi:hypothetical protein
LSIQSIERFVDPDDIAAPAVYTGHDQGRKAGGV